MVIQFTELLVLDINTCNYLTLCKQLQYLIVLKQINSNLKKRNKIAYKLFTYKSYVYPFNCVQTND